MPTFESSSFSTETPGLSCPQLLDGFGNMNTPIAPFIAPSIHHWIASPQYQCPAIRKLAAPAPCPQ